jgi:hypothetical protein
MHYIQTEIGSWIVAEYLGMSATIAGPSPGRPRQQRRRFGIPDRLWG